MIRQRNLGLDEPTVKTQTATERVGKARIRGPRDLELKAKKILMHFYS